MASKAYLSFIHSRTAIVCRTIQHVPKAKYRVWTMKFEQVLFLVTRFSFGLFWLLTSVYCLLAYIPFSHYWVINCPLVWWLPAFVRFHTFLYWLTLSGVILTLLPELVLPHTRKLVRSWIGVQGIVGILLVFHPLLVGLPNDEQSYIRGLLALIPLLWVGAIDMIAYFKRVPWGEPLPRLNIGSILSTALVIWIIYLVLVPFRNRETSYSSFSSSDWLCFMGWSLAGHVLIFCALYVVYALVHWLSARLAISVQVEFGLLNLLAWGIGGWIIKKFVLTSLSFDPLLSSMYAFTFSGILVFFVSGIGLRILASQVTEVQSGLEAVLVLLKPSPSMSWPIRSIWLVGILILAYLLPTQAEQSDWDFILQKLSVFFIWLLILAFFTNPPLWRTWYRRPRLELALCLVIGLGLYQGLNYYRLQTPDIDIQLNQYETIDLSFKVIKPLIFPERRISGLINEDTFFEILQRSANIPGSTYIRPVEVNLTDNLKFTPGDKPHIFLFVVDSLRQDYLSPYNPNVLFTPEIEAFSHESVVFKNSFTTYTGTVLAEPAIWTGGMIPHKQYVIPFYPLNSLQKLLDVEQYDQFINVDPVLQIILQPSPLINRLDVNKSWIHYDFCSSLKELQQKIESRPDPTKPIFSYIQPQNVHAVSIFAAIRDQRFPPPPAEAVPGFNPARALQLKYIDQCFGDFIRFLKARGLYDDSVVIITSDHGDSLGEEGRWGHTGGVFPEVARIPLIIHLPAKYQHRLVWDPQHTTLSTDITPSLFYLIGHKHLTENDIFGRPLFTDTRSELEKYQKKFYLIGHSYGPSYGVLPPDASHLFIATANKRIEYYYDLSTPMGRHIPITNKVRDENEQIILNYLQSIHGFYQYNSDLQNLTPNQVLTQTHVVEK